MRSTLARAAKQVSAERCALLYVSALLCIAFDLKAIPERKDETERHNREAEQRDATSLYIRFSLDTLQINKYERARCLT